jgi:hypothetical protein
MKNIFDFNVSNEVVERINKLSNSSTPSWGKMDVAQMLAHCNVTYEFLYEDKHSKPTPIAKFFLKLFVKNIVCGDKPYKKQSQTAPAFLIKEKKIFDNEKTKLIENILKTQKLGESYFDNRESHSFGKLTVKEWNNMFYKHLDHHLSQFGV